MKKLFFWVMAVVLAVGLFLPGVIATKVSANPGNLTIGAPTLFTSLDGSASDDDGVVNGVLTVNGNLTITTGGSITCNDDPPLIPNASACPITIVVNGNMEMQAGSSIYAENLRQGGSGGNIIINVGGNLTLKGGTPGAVISSTRSGGGTGNAGNITITVGNCAVTPPTGDIVVEPGAVIKANASNGAAGAIVMNACYAINMDGLVESASGQSGTGAFQGPGGGPITLDAGCDLTISDTGVVSSRGQNPGADLVHLEACDVIIFGLVESTGVGHAVPNSPKNHLNSTYRPDKPANSTAGVEVWAGTILIDKTGTHNGEINADLCCSGGTNGTSWIDLLASGDITIIGASSGNFAVHANENTGTGGSGSQGGIVTTKSTTGNITASGLAFQADGGGGGGDGGLITVEAANNVDVSSGTLQAQGSTGGNLPHGGVISIRSFNGNITSNSSSILNVTGGNPAPSGGAVNLTACGTIGFPPGSVVPATIVPTKTTGSCGGAPTLQSYVLIPPCDQCRTECCQWCNKSAVLSQVYQNMGDNRCAIPDILVDLRLDTTTVDTTKLGTDEPATGSLQAAVDYINAHGDLNSDGFLFIGVIATKCEDIPECNCAKSRPLAGDNPFGTENVVITNTHTQRLNVFGCSVSLHAADANLPVITIEDSVGKVTVLDIHVSGSHVAGYLIQNNADLVVVKNSRSFGASGIGYWVKDNDVEITGSAEISGNDIGILVEGSYVTLRTNNDINNNGIGIKIIGDNNESNGNDVGEKGKPNGTGILLESGKDNLLHGDNVIYNTGDGIVVAGSGTSLANGNTIKDEDTQYNGGDGIVVSGSYNTVEGNGQVKFNKGDGFEVSGNHNMLEGNTAENNGGIGINVSAGSFNTLKKNVSKSNTGHGIKVGGNNNSVQENTGVEKNGGDGFNVSGNQNTLYKNRAKENTGDGFEVSGSTNTLEENRVVEKNKAVGFNVTGSQNTLKKNEAKTNTSFEFSIAASNIDGTGNKKNGASFTFTAAGGNFE